MIFQLCQAMIGAEQGGGAIGSEGQVSQLRRSVAAHAVSRHSLEREFQLLLVKRQPEVGADSSTVARVVEGANRARRRKSVNWAQNLGWEGPDRGSNRVVGIGARDGAGIDAVAEIA